MPEQYGPWQTVWKRHRRYSGDGTWDRILAALLSDAQEVELIDWAVSVDSTINRAHRHATKFPRRPGRAPETSGFHGWPTPSFDAGDYKGRNVVERSFDVYKQWRGLATRYDKPAITCRGGAVLRAVTIWLKDLWGDTP